MKMYIKLFFDYGMFENFLMKFIIFFFTVRPTKISLTGVDKHAIHGSNVTLECLVQGARPAANLTWYNGSNPIDPEKVKNIVNVQVSVFITKKYF